MYKKIVILTILILLTVSLAVMAQNSLQENANNYQNKIFSISNDQSLSPEQKAQKMEQANTEFMQKIINDPNAPQELKDTTRKSLEYMKQAKVEQVKREEENRIKEEEKRKIEEEGLRIIEEYNKGAFTITDKNGQKYHGRVINGSYYFLVNPNKTKIPNFTNPCTNNGKICHMGSNTYTSYDLLTAAHHQCIKVTPNSDLVQLDEIKNICEYETNNNIKLKNDLKKYSNSFKNYYEYLNAEVKIKKIKKIGVSFGIVFTHNPDQANYSAFCTPPLSSKASDDIATAIRNMEYKNHSGSLSYTKMEVAENYRDFTTPYFNYPTVCVITGEHPEWYIDKE